MKSKETLELDYGHLTHTYAFMHISTHNFFSDINYLFYKQWDY